MRYSMEAAASILGISGRTLARRINAGQITTERDEKDKRKVWVILEEQVATGGGQVPASMTETFGAFATMLREKDQRIEELRVEAQKLAAQLGRQVGLNEALQSQVKLLMTPKSTFWDRFRGRKL